MGNGWTPQRRARQAEAIKSWKPWKKSTGPKTDRGKLASSVNAAKHGGRSAQFLQEMKQLKAFVAKCQKSGTRI